MSVWLPVVTHIYRSVYIVSRSLLICVCICVYNIFYFFIRFNFSFTPNKLLFKTKCNDKFLCVFECFAKCASKKATRNKQMYTINCNAHLYKYVVYFFSLFYVRLKTMHIRILQYINIYSNNKRFELLAAHTKWKKNRWNSTATTTAIVEA